MERREGNWNRVQKEVKYGAAKRTGGGTGLEQVKESLVLVLLIFEISVGTLSHEQLEMSHKELEIQSPRGKSWLDMQIWIQRLETMTNALCENHIVREEHVEKRKDREATLLCV